MISWLKANPDKASPGTASVCSVIHVAGVLNETGTRFGFVPLLLATGANAINATPYRLCDGRHSGDVLLARNATHGTGRDRDRSRPGCNVPRENTQKSGVSACGSGATP